MLLSRSSLVGAAGRELAWVEEVDAVKMFSFTISGAGMVLITRVLLRQKTTRQPSATVFALFEERGDVGGQDVVGLRRGHEVLFRCEG
jgi:hypothetical protein